MEIFHILALLTLVSCQDSVYLTQPQQTDSWQAGKPANMSWQAKPGSQLTDVTIEMYPTTNAMQQAKVAAILARNVDTTQKSSLIVNVPDNLPAWKYALRLYDPNQSGMSYSAIFWVLDKDGNNATDFDNPPKFPSVYICSDGSICTNSSSSDPRQQKSQAYTQSVGLWLTLLSVSVVVCA